MRPDYQLWALNKLCFNASLIRKFIAAIPAGGIFDKLLSIAMDYPKQL